MQTSVLPSRVKFSKHSSFRAWDVSSEIFRKRTLVSVGTASRNEGGAQVIPANFGACSQASHKWTTLKLSCIIDISYWLSMKPHFGRCFVALSGYSGHDLTRSTLHSVQTESKAHQAPGVMRPGLETDDSPPSSDEVQELWSYNFTPHTFLCHNA
jgi:hypothetical protein